MHLVIEVALSIFKYNRARILKGTQILNIPHMYDEEMCNQGGGGGGGGEYIILQESSWILTIVTPWCTACVCLYLLTKYPRQWIKFYLFHTFEILLYSASFWVCHFYCVFYKCLCVHPLMFTCPLMVTCVYICLCAWYMYPFYVC